MNKIVNSDNSDSDNSSSSNSNSNRSSSNRSSDGDGDSISDGNINGLQCPVPVQNYPHVILGHGGGGRLSAELIEQLFVPALGSEHLEPLSDAAVRPFPPGRLAFTTDSYVVQPLFYPGGNIGSLAVHGTINDLAMSGARPLYLSAGFILEEGLPLPLLQQIAAAMGAAARKAGVAIITGDTKVVQRGHGDGCYINTAGVGVVPAAVQLQSAAARPGDVVLVSGTLGDHGMAIMSVREGLQFESPIVSDSAPLHDLVAKMVAASPAIRALRDPTRGGLAACLNEIAQAADVGIVLEEASIPVLPAVAAACELLGFDPLLVANEGKLVAVVAAEAADAVLAVMQSDPLGRQSAKIGTVVANHRRVVVARTAIGASRIVTCPLGEQLPRIC